VANAAATIARNGLFLPPRLIDDSNLRDRRTLELPPRVSRDLKLPPATLEAVQDAMFAVVNEPGGTAYKYAFGSPVQICGKSGTSQTSRPGLNTSWFIGYAPRNDPRIAFAIVLEYTPAEESGGGRLCGPLGKELVTICHELEYFNQPDTSTNRNDTGN
ncbi:MAG: hypothetical protein HQ546_07165, partial [Planctomycetes bacterium]|nr:hypothetical protein [Planctomycetota bacterium]